MVVHLILFRPRAGLPAPARRALADALTNAIRAIPSVRRVSVGRRVTHGRGYEQMMRTDFSYAAMLQFDDVEGLTEYLEHPAHEELAARFFDAFEEALMYDYEVEEGEAGIQSLV